MRNAPGRDGRKRNSSLYRPPGNRIKPGSIQPKPGVERHRLSLSTVFRLEVEIPKQIIRAKKAERLPTVLSKAEAIAVLNQINSVTKRMAQILYGSGLRLMACLRLRAIISLGM